jgi:hypothetical protein
MLVSFMVLLNPYEKILVQDVKINLSPSFIIHNHPKTSSLHRSTYAVQKHSSVTIERKKKRRPTNQYRVTTDVNEEFRLLECDAV